MTQRTAPPGHPLLEEVKDLPWPTVWLTGAGLRERNADSPESKRMPCSRGQGGEQRNQEHAVHVNDFCS